MAIIPSISGREHSKFVESPTRPGQAATEVVATVSNDPNPFSVPAEADAFTREVSGNSVIYKFRQGGLSGAVLKTVTMNYTNPPDPDLTGGIIA